MYRATGSIEIVTEGTVERRGTSRFPLREDVRYKLAHGKVVTARSGRTVNIGSGGVLFTTEHPLPIGRTVEVAINWPALLDGIIRFRVLVGAIVKPEKRR
jgi:hypothetical protein